MPARSELVDVTHQAAAEVGSLVLGDNILAAEALQKRAALVVGGCCLLLVIHFANVAHGCTRSLRPVTVLNSPLLGLAYSLQ